MAQIGAGNANEQSEEPSQEPIQNPGAEPPAEAEWRNENVPPFNPKVNYSRNKMSNYGRLKIPGDYSKENIVDRGNEWANLWAHHVLSENDFSIEAHGHEDIDLKINGQWWEVKSPNLEDSQSDDGNNLGFIGWNLRKGIRQFKKRGLSETRIVSIRNIDLLLTKTSRKSSYSG